MKYTRDKKWARQIKRARQRQRIALRIKELRTLKKQGLEIFNGILCLKGLSKNYPKL